MMCLYWLFMESRVAVIKAQLPDPQHCPSPATGRNIKAQRQMRQKSAMLTCPEVNIFPLLNYSGAVPQVGTSTLDSGPATGIVPLAAALPKLRNQSIFCSVTSTEFISTSRACSLCHFCSFYTWHSKHERSCWWSLETSESTSIKRLLLLVMVYPQPN